MTTIIAIISEKGGIGKTTLATTMAAGLASRGNRTLLLDISSQANSTMAFHVQPTNGVTSLLLGRKAFKDVAVQAFGDRPLLIVPGGKKTALMARDINPLLLRQRLAELEGHMDFVVIDTSPTLGALHVACYFASKFILVPTQCEFYSIEGIAATLTDLESARQQGKERNLLVADIVKIVPNMYESREAVQKQNLEWIRDKYGADNVLSPIKKRTAWKQASQMRLPIFDYDPNSAAAKDANRFLAEVVGALQ